MIKFDFHLHSDFSSDSREPMEKMICSAIEKGLKIICFTEHNDFDYPLNEKGEIEFLLETNSYKERLFSLKEKYKTEIDVRFGVELGLMPQISEKCDSYINSYNFDFVIGSSHLCGGIDPYYPEFWQTRTEKDGYHKYFYEIYENLLVYNNFDVYGHLDYIVRYGKSKSYNPSEFSDIIDSILKLLIEKSKGIEINTGGLKYGLGFANPHDFVLKRYRELGGEIITIGSDGHQAQHIAYDFSRAEEILHKCGFRYYSVFKERKAEMIKI